MSAFAKSTHSPEDTVANRRLYLEQYLATCTSADALHIKRIEKLSGGAIQENWLIEASISGGDWDGTRRWVLRTDAPANVNVSMTRAEEFAVLEVVYSAGVQVPQPLWLCREHSIIGRDFFIMQAIPGTAAGHRLVRDDTLVPDRALLCRDLGRNLARIHAIAPPLQALNFLPNPTADPAQRSIDQYLEFLDALDGDYPVIEWGLRWLQNQKPEPVESCLVHRDFRTGNFMVNDGRVSGVLDWEFTGWGDWREDIGWFTANCWRFGRLDRSAGGIGTLTNFMEGYSEVGTRSIPLDELRYWQLMAHVRWAIIAVQQAERHLSGKQPSLELALTGRMVPELEYEILALTGVAK